MARLQELVLFLDAYLDNDSVKDDSWNGLQVEGKESVQKVVFAVDAGMDKRLIFRGHSPDNTAAILKQITRPDDIVLVKGSRGMKMEVVVRCFTTSSTR